MSDHQYRLSETPCWRRHSASTVNCSPFQISVNGQKRGITCAELLARVWVHHTQRLDKHGLFGFYGFMAKFIHLFSGASVISRMPIMVQGWTKANLRPKYLLWSVVLAATSWGLGWVPEVATDFSQITLTSAAYAQNRHPKFQQYQDAIHEIEPIRKKYWQKIQDEMRGNPEPVGTCKSHTLPVSVKKLCQQFNHEFMDVLDRHNLTRQEFIINHDPK